MHINSGASSMTCPGRTPDRHDAGRGLLFAGRPGLELVNAALELFERDGLHDLAQDIRFEFEPRGPERTKLSIGDIHEDA